MNYYEVALLTYSGDESIFTYESKDTFCIGQAVHVPLRKMEMTGIVLKSVNKPRFKTKSITAPIFDKPVINQNLINIAFWMSQYYGASLVSVLQTMIPSGITKKRRKIMQLTVNRQQLTGRLKLTEDQEKIFKAIKKDLKVKPHLIFGVTGSGKTEIYLQLIEKVLEEGKDAIVLVPEIALTPQTMSRFTARFGELVTILHSNLKETERFANWKSVLDGEKKVVIGSRSALFAPCQNLGLIVIDEAHESSYKQDKTPRYNAIKVAEKLAKETDAGLILGSATPNLETFYRAKKGELSLHTLEKRIVQASMPETEIIDMRSEFRSGNKSIFSERLLAEMKKALSKKQQIILFLNRRGMSTFVSCRDCGFVEKCSNCDIPLTFHYNTLRLTCHHCGQNRMPAVVCPECKGTAIKYFGTGTQRIEQEIVKIFGKEVKIARMDKDTTTTRGSHEDLYKSFVQGELDILVGTQMIAKGWDLPNVGLVGVISADTTLNFPDYSAEEKTFNLLTQVSGRTGRGKEQGVVVIQTYNPDNFAIRAAGKHDYLRFYQEEIKNREELLYPPFAHLVKMLYNNSVQESLNEESKQVALEIASRLQKMNLEYRLLGPSPAFIPKINNKYYSQIIIKIVTDKEDTIIEIAKILNNITKNKWSIDIDPEGLI